MSKSKIKSFIIIVLCLVNLFLLAMVASDFADSAASARQAEKRIADILLDNGITLSGGAKLPSRAPTAKTSRRDLQAELKLVSRVLGDAEAIDEGGGIYTYIGENGRAYFRGTGEFALEPAAGSVPEGGSAMDAAVKYIKKMGMDCDFSLTEENSDMTGSNITLVCSLSSGAVFNCRVNVFFSNGYLALVSGRREPDIIADEEGAEALGVTTILLRFIDIVRESGYICSEITDIRAGYTLNSTASGEGTLTPVWRVSTDTGVYYVNGLTGKLETIS